MPDDDERIESLLELPIEAIEQMQRIRAKWVELNVDYHALMDDIFEAGLNHIEGKLALLGDEETLKELAARHRR